MALAAKYGQGAPAPTVAEAAARLESYERAARAALAHREGAARAPVSLLGDGQLAALYAPRALETLVGPLRRAPLQQCDPP